MKGRYHWNKLVPPEVRKSIQFFQQAIDADPNYALAYTGLAASYVSLPITSDVPPGDAFPQAKAAATRALEIDESLADAHAYLAFVNFWFDWDWSTAEREAKRGITLNPNSSEAHRAYGILLSQVGRHREAIAEGVRARELDPLALITRTNEALFLYYAGHDNEAEEKLIKTLEIEPNFWIALLTLAKVYLRQGRHSEAIASLTNARKYSGGSTQPIAMLGFACAIAGDLKQAHAILAELKSLSQQRYVPPCNFAIVYNGLNADDEALHWLERAYDVRDVLLAAFIRADPNWDRLRSNPRLAAILKAMKLE